MVDLERRLDDGSWVARRRQSVVHGVVVVDKPAGVTSHDVVKLVRRQLGERRVGHAGTLDPMATGVLVVMVGEATKLGPFLTANDKSYDATVALGKATDTLDADGVIEDSAALPPWWMGDQAAARVEQVLDRERRRVSQAPPIYSAIKIAGKTAHARARAGEAVALEPRPVAVRQIAVRSLDIPTGRVDLRLTVSKGYYVRSLARDLGQALGVPSHLCALRRTASGAFVVADAVPPDDDLMAQLVPIADAATRAMPAVTLTAAGVERVGFGGPMQVAHFTTEPPRAPVSAWLDAHGRLHAIGRWSDDTPTIVRGFQPNLNP